MFSLIYSPHVILCFGTCFTWMLPSRTCHMTCALRRRFLDSKHFHNRKARGASAKPKVNFQHDKLNNSGAAWCSSKVMLLGELLTDHALKQVSLRAEGGGDQYKFDDALKRALELILLRVSVAKPLEITARATDTFYIFTDGAFENQKGSIGGVLFDSSGRPLEFFAAVLSDESMIPFLAESRNPIYELELLPVAITFSFWAKRLHHRQLMCYLDNDAARAALIKGRGSASFSDHIVHRAMVYETQHAFLSWCSRVPTASNPGNDPSRLRFEHLVSAMRVSVSLELVASLSG